MFKSDLQPIFNATDMGHPEQDEHGIDLSLIRYSLTLTPAQRIEQNYHARVFADRLRGAALAMGRDEHAFGSTAANPAAPE